MILRGLPIAALLALAAPGPAAAQAPGSPPDYVGSTACAECHGEVAERWARSHHALAWTVPGDNTVRANFDGASFTGEGMDVRFRREAEAYIASVTEADGSVRDYPVHSVIGVAPLQQFVLESARGRMQAFDLAWDVERRIWYHLYPGQELAPGDALHWTGAYKNWNGRCAECHATGFRKRYDPAARTYGSTWAEMGVGCEGCHGPGAAHVALARGGALPAGTGGVDAKGFTVAFDAEDAEAEIQQCAGCHARREPGSDGNPLPGTPFHDAYRLQLLRPGLYHADGQVNDEVYVYGSFLQAKMYARGVRCTDCHDPHDAQPKAQGNAVCTQCHSPTGNPRFPTLRSAVYDAPSHHFHEDGDEAAQCTSCHMPEKVYMGVDGRRDHSFRVPRPDLAADTGAPDACTACHSARTPAWAADEIARRFPEGHNREPHYGEVIAAAWERPGKNIAELVATASDPGQPGIVRATALDLLGRQGDAETAEAVATLLADPDPLVRAHAVTAQRPAPRDDRAGRLPALLADPVRLVRLAAARELLDVSAADILPDDAESFGAAMAEWQRSLSSRLDFPETHIVLGGVALAMRNLPAASGAFREAVNLDDRNVDAWTMLIRVVAASRGAVAAEAVAAEALAANPDSDWLAGVSAQLKESVAE